MPRETVAAKRERAIEIARRMNEHYPKAECALHYDCDPFRLVIAVLLSAQTTDKGVNKVTPALWKRYPTPADLASADVTDVEEIIRAIGFYRTKAANCVKCAQLVVSEYGGEVPRDIDELQKLPGVGRKTANVVLNEAFGIVEGIAVDTHVFRIAHKLKLVGPSAEEMAKIATLENGNRLAQALPARLLGADQPSMGALRARNVHRAAAQVRGVLPCRRLPELREEIAIGAAPRAKALPQAPYRTLPYTRTSSSGDAPFT